jgi:hypothetical protein
MEFTKVDDGGLLPVVLYWQSIGCSCPRAFEAVGQVRLVGAPICSFLVSRFQISEVLKDIRTHAFVAVPCFQRATFLTQAFSMRTQRITSVAARIFSSHLGLAWECCSSRKRMHKHRLRPPFIDMHVHSTNTTPEAVRGRMDRESRHGRISFQQPERVRLRASRSVGWFQGRSLHPINSMRCQ